MIELNVGLFLLWILIGWYASGLRDVPLTKGADTQPWFLPRLIGIVGAIIGGLLFNMAWPVGASPGAVEVAATCIGAFLGALIVADLFGFVQRRRA